MGQATVSATFKKEFSQIRLVVSQQQNLSSPSYSPIYATVNKTAKMTITGLSPNVQYYYGIEVNGVLQQNGRGKFKAFPNPGTASNFICAFSSCVSSNSNHAVFSTIRQLNPAFFIHMGDFHYDDIEVNNPDLYRAGFDKQFAQPNQANFYADIPIAYMWDDHDYGYVGNHSDKNITSKPSAHQVYRERVPHYPLEGGAMHPIYQTFVYGRVRFILTDLHTERDNYDQVDNSSKSHLGFTQRQWLFDQLLKPEPLKVWVNTQPWIDRVKSDDNWSYYTTERRIIADFIKSNNLEKNLIMLSGDMHALAIDDGTNSDFTTSGGGGFPVIHASPLDRYSSSKGGPYKYGPFENNSDGNHYGVLEILDNGVEINVTMKGMRGATLIITHSLKINEATAPDKTPPTVTILPADGAFSGTQVISLTADKQANIYYTTDGSTPTTSSTKYANPFTINNTTVVKYFGVDELGNASTVLTKTYTKNVEVVVLASDSFNRAANPTSMGSTDSHKGGTVRNWVVHGSGSYGIDSNGYAYCSQVAASGRNVAYVDTGVADANVSVTLALLSGSETPKLAFRIVDSANKFMFSPKPGGYDLYFVQDNVVTDLGTWTNRNPSNGDRLTVTAEGPNIKCYLDGVLIISANSSFNQTATKWGICGYKYSNSRFDDFEVTGIPKT